MKSARFVLLSRPPFPPRRGRSAWLPGSDWPCVWVGLPGARPPAVVAYRCRLRVPAARSVRVHVSADERYGFFVDGRHVGRGPQRGDPSHWRFETYDLELERGSHVFVALVQMIGKAAHCAQLSSQPGLMFTTEDADLRPLLSTGEAKWEAKVVAGLAFGPGDRQGMVGPSLILDGRRYPWGIERGQGRGWKPTVSVEPAAHADDPHGLPPCHGLTPAELPAMIEQPITGPAVRFAAAVDGAEDPAAVDAQPIREAQSSTADQQAWQALLTGDTPLSLPAGQSRRVVIDLGDYHCAFPVLRVSGGAGARVRIGWAEALFETPPDGESIKGHRDAIDAKYFRGMTDTFLPDGRDDRQFTTLWWRAGRYVQIVARTAAQPLVIQSLRFDETRYPLEVESRFACSDARLGDFVPIAVRSLAMCMHETYMDCPAYEQLMYVGDTRLQALVTFVLSRDSRLPRKALRVFNEARDSLGFTPSRHPSRVRQRIGPFSLFWTGMLRDYAWWRDDGDFVAACLPGMRCGLEAVLAFRNSEGLIESLPGWNFFDWVERSRGWRDGVPPGGDQVSGMLNWQVALALTEAADLERHRGHPHLAAHWRDLARQIADACIGRFWVDERGLFADCLSADAVDHQHFSQHTQCLAVLSGLINGAQRRGIADNLLDPRLSQVTIYFSHYLFEALRLLGRGDEVVGQLSPWFDLRQQGFRTTPEWIRPAVRSDCHAWGAHPLYHYFATILGIRPAAPGFAAVHIRPCPGPLTQLSGRLVHPRGCIEIDLQREDDHWTGAATLPQGVSGTLDLNGRTHHLQAGQRNRF